MRFHMGVSFNLRKLKKYIIPFIIGILGFLGIGLLGCINVYALEDEEIIEETTEQEDNNLQDVYVINDSTYLQGLSNKVYWFQNPTTSNDVLVNIYVLLFLYCVGMTSLKFISIVHNVSWKNRR